jgi:hypothetical protein
MASVTHAKVVTTPDDGTTEVGSTEWNDEHVVTGVREMLEADRDYYVDSSLGSDSNTGLTSGAGAFATIQKAIDVVCDTLDLQGYDVVINCAAGNHAGEINLRRYVGGGEPNRLVQYNSGNETQSPYNHANVTLRGVSGTILTGSTSPVYNRVLRCNGCTTPWFLDRLEFNPTNSGQDAIEVVAGSVLLVGVLTFHAPIGYCFYVARDATVFAQEYSDFIFPGGSYAFFIAVTHNSRFIMPEHCAITIQGASSWSVAFIAAENGGKIIIYRLDSLAITGAQTGRRWYTFMGGEIAYHHNTGSYQDMNSVLPGSTVGAHFDYGTNNGLTRLRGLNLGASTVATLRAPGVGALGLEPLTVTTLTTTPYGGQICYVTDATTNTVATTVVGGSTYNTLVWYNGTNWSIFAS